MIQIDVFKRLRKEKGSQAAIAAKAKVSQQLIGEIESGRTRTTKAIYLIAEALGTSAHVLDPDIPSLEGRAAKLVADLKGIEDDELASSILENFERTVELIKTRIETNPASSPKTRPDFITSDGLIVEVKHSAKSRDSGAELKPPKFIPDMALTPRSYAEAFVSYSRALDPKLTEKITKLLERDKLK